MPWLQSLAAELAITVSNESVWLAVAQGLLFGGISLAFGTWIARLVGLLGSDAPAGETLGVGLASGLMVVAAWWAAVWSGGRSAFTPVAIGFAIAIVQAVARRSRSKVDANAGVEAAKEIAAGRTTFWLRNRSLVLTTLAGGIFIVAVALLYGATIAPSPRDGLQPIENNDEAFYAILGRDLAATGTETTLSPSGFSDLQGLPAQTWYHWGELWLASAVIAITGTAPLPARCFVVLPVVLLAAAALTGTLVRRLARTSQHRAYLFGFLACLFLAPVPLTASPFFSSWAAGLMFGITLYGLAAAAALLALYCLAVLGARKATWALAAFVGSATAFILPAHIVIAFLALVGVGSVWTIRIVQSLTATGSLPLVSRVWRRSLVATGIALIVTVAWSVLTGHGLGGSSAGIPPTVSPFNASWGMSVAAIYLGAGAFLAIPLAWVLARREARPLTDIYLGTMALILVGAVVWGARLGDFLMFHVFFGGIAVFATPVAALAAWSLWEHLRATRHLRLAIGVVAICVIQLEFGGVHMLLRLQQFGPADDSEPIPVSLVTAIRHLPTDAKLAYSCQPFEEVAFTDQRLLGIAVHTARPVVPMCFQADVFSTLVGARPTPQVPNAAFAWAPQRALYPDAEARPSSAAITDFLKNHGIDYIYADRKHPNSLVVDAIPVATSGDAQVLRLP